jgi:GTP-dependent phosphoenolpyruvate carboxykinase
METSRVSEWVQLCANWCEPDWVHWCDGSARDVERLVKLSAAAVPAFAPAEEKCVAPAEAMRRIAVECGGCLRGQTLFVVPSIRFGDEPGVLVTDSAARAAEVCRTASVGAEALKQLETGCEFTAHLYLTGREDSIRTSVSIRCHLSGPEVIETSCRTPTPRRLVLPMESRPAADKPSCLSCPRLCPTRARAIVSAAGRPHA